jgi:energy-coupling factor transporter transmembrane protein EcfT
MAGRIRRPPAELPFAYKKGNTILHRCPALVKIAALLVLSVFAFSSIPGLAIAAFIIVPASFCARLRPRDLLWGSRPLFLLAFFLVLYKSLNFKGFSMTGFLDGLRQALCILVSFAAASLVFSVTTMAEIRSSLGNGRLSLGISLMLGFIPRFFAVWEEAEIAFKARGGKNGPARLVFLVPLTIEKMMEKAAETAEALEARGFPL